MFKGLGNLTGMLQQAREMQEKMSAARDRVAAIRVEGSSGGEMVRIQATGDLSVTGVTIEPSLLESQNRELLEDLLTAAVNEALSKAKEAAAREMAQVTSGLNIPGLQDALSKLGLS